MAAPFGAGRLERLSLQRCCFQGSLSSCCFLVGDWWLPDLCSLPPLNLSLLLCQEISGWYYLLGEALGRTKHLKVARRRLRPLRGRRIPPLASAQTHCPPKASPTPPFPGSSINPCVLWHASPQTATQTVGPGTSHEHLLECNL